MALFSSFLPENFSYKQYIIFDIDGLKNNNNSVDSHGDTSTSILLTGMINSNFLNSNIALLFVLET